jgi:kynurenine formamidase
MLFDQLRSARVFDLSQPYYPGMPHFPTHPPYLFGLTKLHGEFRMSNGGSSASEAISFGGHVGTHIDALTHFSCDGRLYGGAALEQSPFGGVRPHSVDTIAPIVRRGVLLDAARATGYPELPPDYTITPELLEESAKGISIEPGDIVLLRTGWARYWKDANKFLTGGDGKNVRGPGPELEAAQWLSAKGVFAVGSDTVGFEKMPSREMAVHLHLLVDKGIHIMECLNMEELSESGVREFVFIATPLRFEGGTGSPLRPIALAPAV